MSTGARNRRNGARFETEVVKHLRSIGYDTERLRLSGRQDEGDLVARLEGDKRLVLELKSGKNIRPRHWYSEEAVPEARNYARTRDLPDEQVVPVLVMKTHHRPIKEALVTLSLADLLALVN